jgi:myo-inositol-1(or 4)-monophosphatase
VQTKIWDIHPIMPIVRASGAIVTTWDNKNPVAGGNIIISNNIVNHNKVLKLLKPVSK